jgi:hypothetical protein
MSNQSPVKFLNAEIRQSKETGNHYLWSKPVDLKECIAELGASVVNITVTTPKNARNEFQRVIVFKPALIKAPANANQTYSQQSTI